MTQDPERAVLRRFVVDNFLFGRDNQLSDHDSFLENGVIDSTGILELISFLEGRYGIKIADEDLVKQNLDSIDNLVGFLDRKLVA